MVGPCWPARRRHGPRGFILVSFGEPNSTNDRSKNRYDEQSGSWPGRSWPGPWGPGCVSEGLCGVFGVGSGAPTWRPQKLSRDGKIMLSFLNSGWLVPKIERNTEVRFLRFEFEIEKNPRVPLGRNGGQDIHLARYPSGGLSIFYGTERLCFLFIFWLIVLDTNQGLQLVRKS